LPFHRSALSVEMSSEEHKKKLLYGVHFLQFLSRRFD
jgi:hypothetical protein